MKQSLQLKLGQHLAMTPQLQQAIRLLQLSTLDLQQEIQAIIEANPMLETMEDSDQASSNAAAERDNDDRDGDNGSNDIDFDDQSDSGFDAQDSLTPLSREQEYDTPSSHESSADYAEATSSVDGDSNAMDSDWNNDIPDDLPVDTKWDDIYTSSSSSASSSSGEFNEMPDFDARNVASTTLSEHLEWQLNLTPMTDKDRYIAEVIIDALNPSGLLESTVEDLHSSFDPELDVELDEIEAVRHRLQQFDPIGVASVDLNDCLMVQLAHLPSDTPWREQAAMIIHRHLALLAARDFTQLMRRTRLKEQELSEVISLIRSLNPRPGDAYNDNTAEYVVPDVFVSKKAGKWVVELNPDIAPKIHINAHYAAMIKRADSSADNTYLRNNLQEAKWFLKSLHSRNETLLKVATRIVEHQKEFFERGEEAMKPLILQTIAEDVEMHESTISRVTTQKYMHTPRGIFELKYFFSSHVATAEGGECSSTAIRAIIKKLVAVENSRKPLSDNKIASILDEKGIKVARRTVAKYRESMLIPPSNERKRLA